jgi:hypothetical protein
MYQKYFVEYYFTLIYRNLTKEPKAIKIPTGSHNNKQVQAYIIARATRASPQTHCFDII